MPGDPRDINPHGWLYSDVYGWYPRPQEYSFTEWIKVEDLLHCSGCRCWEPSETNKKPFKKNNKKV